MPRVAYIHVTFSRVTAGGRSHNEVEIHRYGSYSIDLQPSVIAHRHDRDAKMQL